MPATSILFLALVAGMLAGIIGWNHPHGETRDMSRAFGVLSLLVAAGMFIWDLL